MCVQLTSIQEHEFSRYHATHVSYPLPRHIMQMLIQGYRLHLWQARRVSLWRAEVLPEFSKPLLPLDVLLTILGEYMAATERPFER